MMNAAQAELPADDEIMSAVAEAGDLLFGVYARVITPGRVRVGDEVVLT
jgi:MOSC domain-containing protein YiiM